MKRDNQVGCICRTGIACQALVPGKPPMCALRSGPDLLSGRLYAWWRERSGAFQVDGLAANHFEPGSPDATAWPVTPEHWSRSRRCAGWMGRRRGIRVRRGKRPQDRTHPSWLERGTALLTLRTLRAGTAMTNTRSIQDSQGAIALRAPLLEIERVIGRTA